MIVEFETGKGDGRFMTNTARIIGITRDPVSGVVRLLLQGGQYVAVDGTFDEIKQRVTVGWSRLGG